MEINIKPLLNGEKRKVSFSYEIPLDYAENGYKIKNCARISGEIRDMGGYMLLEAFCEAEYETKCARCLKPITGVCSINFSRPVAVRLEANNDDEEYILVNENSSVEIDVPLTEELILSLPIRSLCKDDCLGLCPKCGCNKNDTECSCITKDIDPRWAALKNFRPKDGE